MFLPQPLQAIRTTAPAQKPAIATFGKVITPANLQEYWTYWTEMANKGLRSYRRQPIPGYMFEQTTGEMFTVPPALLDKLRVIFTDAYTSAVPLTRGAYQPTEETVNVLAHDANGKYVFSPDKEVVYCKTVFQMILGYDGALRERQTGASGPLDENVEFWAPGFRSLNLEIGAAAIEAGMVRKEHLPMFGKFAEHCVNTGSEDLYKKEGGTAATKNRISLIPGPRTQVAFTLIERENASWKVGDPADQQVSLGLALFAMRLDPEAKLVSTFGSGSTQVQPILALPPLQGSAPLAPQFVPMQTPAAPSSPHTAPAGIWQPSRAAAGPGNPTQTAL
jgi:hypothetical protein